MRSIVLAVLGLIFAAALVSCASTSTETAQACKVHSGHTHSHSKTCGHKTVKHEDHMDYQHDGHQHHVHADHTDDHQG